MGTAEFLWQGLYALHLQFWAQYYPLSQQWIVMKVCRPLACRPSLVHWLGWAGCFATVASDLCLCIHWEMQGGRRRGGSKRLMFRFPHRPPNQSEEFYANEAFFMSELSAYLGLAEHPWASQDLMPKNTGTHGGGAAGRRRVPLCVVGPVDPCLMIVSALWPVIACGLPLRWQSHCCPASQLSASPPPPCTFFPVLPVAGCAAIHSVSFLSHTRTHISPFPARRTHFPTQRGAR